MKDILIINRNPGLFCTFAEYLGMCYGIENVITTASASTALEIIRTAVFDLIIMDLGVPGADRVLGYVTSHHSRIPVMAMGAEGGDEKFFRLRDHDIRKFQHSPLDMRGMAQQILAV